MSEKLYSIISKVFNVSVSEINDDSGPETIESWDSFNGLVLVLELEDTFNVKFTTSEITEVERIHDIKRHLKNHGVSLDE
jgi:acyl carrier protein|tara:strand:- start:979 stop:1218 length:240 start_codon:yes stop_codon:yes gene_type:complete